MDGGTTVFCARVVCDLNITRQEAAVRFGRPPPLNEHGAVLKLGPAARGNGRLAEKNSAMKPHHMSAPGKNAKGPLHYRN